MSFRESKGDTEGIEENTRKKRYNHILLQNNVFT